MTNRPIKETALARRATGSPIHEKRLSMKTRKNWPARRKLDATTRQTFTPATDAPRPARPRLGLFPAKDRPSTLSASELRRIVAAAIG